MKNADADLSTRRKRLLFRGWHRGIKEADLILGGFIEKHLDELSADDCAWFERLFEEQDVDILAWITGKEPMPTHLNYHLVPALSKLDYIPKAE